MIYGRSLILFLAIFLGSCKSTSQSEVKHDFGRFSNSTNSSQWLVADDSMLEATETLTGQIVFLPESEPMSIRLQAWADEIRKKMIETDPRIAAVPRPLVRIIKREGANAFTLPGQVCVDFPLFKDPKAAKGNMYFTDTPYGVFSMESSQCFHHEGSIKDKLAFAEASFSYHPECRILTKDGIHSLSDNCPIEEKTPTDGVTLTAYANRIYIFSGSLAKDESDVVGTIGHELGHYYMAHSRVLPGVYGYFYDENAPNNGKPAPLPDSDPRKQMGLDLLNYRDVDSTVIAGEIYENNVTKAFVFAFQNQGLSTEECTDAAACEKECAVLSAAISSENDLYSLLTPSSEEYRQKYLALQNSFKGCFSRIPSAQYVDAINEQFSMLSAGSSPHLKREGNSSLYELLKQADKMIREFVTSAQQKFVKAEKALKQNPLGYYTHEQEADEISTEISIRLGFDGYNQANSQLKNMNPAEQVECKRKLAAGFPVPESILDYADAHHEACYRVYNIYREINKLHLEQEKGIKKGPIPKLPPDVSWKDMVQKMDQVLGTNTANK